MAIKTRAELEAQLSTGGSSVTVERNFIKDLLDSLDLASEAAGDLASVTSAIDDLTSRVEALEAAAE